MALTPKLLQQGSAGGGPKNYIEDVFSTYLYTGNGRVTTIDNDIELGSSGFGGSVYFPAGGVENALRCCLYVCIFWMQRLIVNF